MFNSVGILRYSRLDNGDYKLIVEVDTEIVRYYRYLTPKWVVSNPQAYPAHISVVRKEEPVFLENWAKYDGHLVEFQYSSTVHSGTVYHWLNAFSTRLEEIRLELGLPVSSPYTRPPDNFSKCFHITIGNRK